MNRRTLLQAGVATAALTLATPALSASPAFPFTKKTASVEGETIAYIDHGTGRPVIFLHGNPTSSYLWRNIIPHLPDGYRAIAPDLIGMGDSSKPDIAYTYADHAKYLHAFLDQLDLQNAIFVIHDWGSTLGMDWARQNPTRISALAFMESFVPPGQPFASYDTMGPLAEMFQLFNSEQGAQMILEQNFFVEEVLAKFGVKTPLPEGVLTEYRRPYPTPESRKPTLAWPRQVPIANTPADVTTIMQATGGWLLSTDIPKLMFHVTPGALMPPEAVAWLKPRLSNLTVVDLGAGAHFIQEDYPDEIGTALADWLNSGV